MAELIATSETAGARATLDSRASGSLLAAVGQALGGDLPRRAAEFIGEDPSRTATALDLLVVAILRRLARRSASQEGGARLFDKLGDPRIDSDVLETVDRLLAETPAAEGERLVAGEQAAQALFGQWTASLVFQVGSNAGLRGEAVWQLLGLATPLVYAALRDHARERGLDAESLRQRLAGEFLVGAFARRRPLYDSVGAAVQRAPQRLRTALARAAEVVTRRDRRTAARGALLVAALVAVAVVAWRGHAGRADASAHADPPDTTNAAASTVGRDASHGPHAAGMDGLRAFLASEASEVEFVMALDGVTFEPASATLRSQSNAQLAQLAAVLAAHPDARATIEAYDDATAHDPALAERRALAVRAALAALGIQPVRMTHARSSDAHRAGARIEARIIKGRAAGRI
jgi:outer membrane protein OmpA-like peptidoglycan-associated protein